MTSIAERIVLTIWVGGMWTTGYIVAPTLFAMLDDRALAGAIAGRLFTIMSYLGLFSVSFLLVSAYLRDAKHCLREWRSWLLGLMLLLVVIGEFGVQPLMAEIRDGGVLEEEKARFGMLHGIASVLFLMTSIAGLVLVIFGLNKKR